MSALKLSAQDLASYAALVVATVALYVGWDQAQIGRNQQHADVYPVIVTKSQYIVKSLPDGRSVRHLSFVIANAGVGPAFVESGDWRIANRQIDKVSDIQQLFPDGLQPIDQYQGQYSGFILAPGEQDVIWEVAFPNDAQSNPLINEFLQDFWQMEMSICYCSLYERCWEARYDPSQVRPVSVKQCGNDKNG